jgi:predicted O-linked N-acetylglucosamine transferase (SPINDLY family)
MDVSRSLSRSREMCEWDEFAVSASHMRALLTEDRSGRLPPFHLLSVPGISAREHRSCSELWTRDRVAASRPERDRLAFHHDLTARDKLRIAYLSNDFHDHATARLLVETFEAHDRERCELHAFSFGADDGGTMRRRLNDAFDVFHDVSALCDAETARAVHDAGINILVDLKGYTRGARTGVMMLHPAPVQVNFLGYPGTLGAEICDYIITDPFVTPMAAASDYSEAFAYMPHSYQPHGRKCVIGPKPTRSEVGLPETGFVFCCFNQAYKFTPSVFDLWCRLLAATPGSVLWLLCAERAEGNLRGEALRRGVAPDRLVFAPDIGQADHLGRLQLADLVLDTAPYGAHTTASDALWVGVPIVTCAGETFPSRVAGSLLHAVGLPELVVANEEDYLAVALTLAAEPGALEACKAKLRRNRLTTPLFDVAVYTRDLENLYETMWSRRRLGAARTPIWTSMA